MLIDVLACLIVHYLSIFGFHFFVCLLLVTLAAIDYLWLLCERDAL